MNPSTYGSIDQWTRGPMDPWGHGRMDPWTHAPTEPWTRGHITVDIRRLNRLALLYHTILSCTVP